ncbi:hypothetical protein [Marinobacterium jannaschii]|uniref:hypothetical protein n=1 Tax=Marinobacterium jannaschii TaxID=64970 RepID=UPI000683FA17|nr:hypothetical protein [Marinobacterium jannaschii]
MMILATQLVLVASALFTAGRHYKAAEQDNSNAFVLSVSACFIAAAAATGLVTTDSVDQQTLQRMLDNLAYFAAVPLLAAALLAQAWQQNWSRAGWGRGLLALFALFELCRRSEVGDRYAQLLAAAAVLTIVVAALRMPQKQLAGIAVAACLAASSLLFGNNSLMPEMSAPALANIALAGCLLFTLPLFQRS